MQNKEIGAIIPIENRDGQQAVNARHLYEWLGVKKQFADWIKMQIVRCDLIENVDYQSFHQKVKREIGATTFTDYALSLNAAKEISMMSQTERGKQARRYFIECERIAKQKDNPALPTTYKEALTQLLAQVESNEQLQLENRRLQEDIHTQHNINNLLQGEVDSLTPKGRIYDMVMQTPQETGLSTTSAVANEIGLSGQRLNLQLIACGIIYKAPNGDYLFTSEYRKWQLGKAVSAVTTAPVATEAVAVATEHVGEDAGHDGEAKQVHEVGLAVTVTEAETSVAETSDGDAERNAVAPRIVGNRINFCHS